ncbi:MAG TPA: cupin domain-containing protein [Firmicutes bacterium]|nr:cupin domain-containing protein [Bacillota bacterium]
MNITLAELAERTGLTASLLSQVERDITTPSIATLRKIADALGTAIGYFFEDEDQPKPPGPKPAAQGRRSPVVHEGQRKILSPNNGVTFYLLNPDMSGPIEFIYDVFEPGASTGDELYTHPGVECGLILEGELEVQVGEDIYLLGKGDSITFSSEVPHRKRNPGKTKSISIWANTPPWF